MFIKWLEWKGVSALKPFQEAYRFAREGLIAGRKEKGSHDYTGFDNIISS